MSTEIHQDRQSDADRQVDMEEEGLYQYRALSSGAVVALVLGLLSLLAMTDYWLVAVPIVGVIWGVVALRQIRARPEELTGRGMAWAGLVLSVVLIPVGPAGFITRRSARCRRASSGFPTMHCSPIRK